MLNDGSISHGEGFVLAEPVVHVYMEPAQRKRLRCWLTEPCGQTCHTHYSLLDMLRGCAAAAVLLAHHRLFFWAPARGELLTGYQASQPYRYLLFPLYDYGYVAVPVFWMLSGFVFSSVYMGRAVTARDFAISRIARLYPLHILTLLLVLGLQLCATARLGGPIAYVANDSDHFALQLLLASNWFTDNASFNGPIWSVSVEILNYALFWSLLPVLFRRGIFGPLLVAAACAILFLLTHANVALCGFYFFGGASLVVLHRILFLRPSLQLTAAAGLSASGLIVFTFGDLSRVAAIAGVSGGVILALAALEGSQAAHRLRPASKWIGETSFGIYLWHFPVLLAILLAFAQLGLPEQWKASPLFLLFFLVAVVSLARVSFRKYEAPMRRRLLAQRGAPPLPSQGSTPRRLALPDRRPGRKFALRNFGALR